jgi:hypothetical protein
MNATSNTKLQEEYIRVRHIADGDYAVIGWKTTLACEPWAALREISGASLANLADQYPHIAILDATR